MEKAKEKHRKSLVKAATSGNRKFFLGTDTAPHFKHDKESECGCAGIFNATYCVPILAQLFDNLGVLNRLEGFLSLHGAEFYGMPHNKERLTLKKTDIPLQMPENLETKEGKITIFDPFMEVYWQIVK